MLIDGNSLTYRAFFALPTDMATASGQVTNAVFGFTSMLLNLIRDHRPDRVVVSFDLPGPTFRHEMVDSYKANRDATPDILREQMGLVRQVVDVFRLPVVTHEGVEADDVIATIATRSAEAGDDVMIVTGDRDSYQLVEDPHIKVLYNRRGVSDYVLYDEAGIQERTGVKPSDYVQYAALRGDKSDNLPGVPGVGEKTAAKLINTYGGLDGIYAAVDEQTPKLRQNLIENEAQARSNLEMMRLVRDVPLDRDRDELQQGVIDPEEVLELFRLLEFPSLVARLPEAFPDVFGPDSGRTQVEVLEAELIHGEDSSDTADRLEAAMAAGTGLLGVSDPDRSEVVTVAVAGSWSGEPGRSPLEGIAVVLDPGPCEVLWIPTDRFDDLGDTFATAFCQHAGIVAHDAKPLLRSLLDLGFDTPTLVLDTKLAAYLLDPTDVSYDIVGLVRRHASLELAQSAAAEAGQLDFGDDTDSAAMIAAREALGVARIVQPITEVLAAQGLDGLNADIEVPLVTVLAKMEHRGIGVDVDVLRSLNEHLAADAETERGEIIRLAGEDFNVNSTKQMREILYDKLGLTPGRRTKTGYSTNQATLEKLRGDHEIIDHILRYREVEKLRSTYGEGLLAEVAEDGRIHATFNQTVARTGRLSSDAPNLHNIPVRTDEGRRFREAFVPDPGNEFLVADYNQIELRVIAHLSNDPGLVEAFTEGRDIHTATAARIFEVAPEDVTPMQRSKSKMVSYGLAYGMEAYGLGQRLAIPTGEAQVILDAYFDAYPSVKAFMERTVAEARDRGYTETEFGRRRRIPELTSSQHNVRMAGERQAMNAPIQGLAADIFKIALVHLDRALRDAAARSDVILQVHDEVIVEVVPGEYDQVEELVLEAMSGAFDLRVPLAVNLSRGHSWAEAKG